MLISFLCWWVVWPTSEKNKNSIKFILFLDTTIFQKYIFASRYYGTCDSYLTKKEKYSCTRYIVHWTYTEKDFGANGITVISSFSYGLSSFVSLFDILFQIHFVIHWEINPIDCQGIWPIKIALCVKDKYNIEQVFYRTSHWINIGKRSNLYRIISSLSLFAKLNWCCGSIVCCLFYFTYFSNWLKASMRCRSSKWNIECWYVQSVAYIDFI